MDRKKIFKYLLISFIIFGLINSINGCGDSGKKITANTEQGTDDFTEALRTDLTEDETKDAIETASEGVSGTESAGENTTVQATTDGIFYWSCEDYFYLLEGEWRAVEYAGVVTDSHDDSTEEDFWEEKREYTNEVTEENLGREFNITKENLEYFGPLDGTASVIKDNTRLFNRIRLIPGVQDNIALTPPYIGLVVRLADKGERYNFIIDAEGTVLIEIDYCFFRLERIE